MKGLAIIPRKMQQKKKKNAREEKNEKTFFCAESRDEKNLHNF
jgi:hypothetical protein